MGVLGRGDVSGHAVVKGKMLGWRREAVRVGQVKAVGDAYKYMDLHIVL